MSDATDLDTMRARIEQTVAGYSVSFILFAACDLGIFDLFAVGPVRCETIAERTNASATGVSRLCTALTALGLLSRLPDGRFAAAPGVVELLGGEGPGSLKPLVLHHQHQLAPLFARLSHAVREGRPQHAAWGFASPGAAQRTCYEELARHPEEYELFLQAMDRGSAGVGDDITRAFDLGDVQRLVDLGGGAGRVARELLAALPRLTLEMLDLPLACSLAQQSADKAGLGDRFHATPADLTKPIVHSAVEPGDAVLLSGVLADFAPADCLQILENAARLLRPGGLLLVSETLLDDARTGPLMPALLSLLMLAATPGDSFTLPELTVLLGRVGFTILEHRPPRAPGRRDLIVAHR
jgi:SAM-dependent methyltransferase